MEHYSNNIEPHQLSEKELKDQELVALHRTVVIQYAVSNLCFEGHQIRKLKKLYDENITRDNIRHYFNRHSSLFILALTQDKLEMIASYKSNLISNEDN